MTGVGGNPVVPGASLKGLLRAAADRLCGAEG